MRFDAHMTRRTAVAAAAVLLLAGCGAGEPAGSVATGSAQASPADTSVGTWDAKLDADAPFMVVDGQEGSAMPDECWMRHEDGTVQVQVAGSSIPEPAVEGIEFADGVLTVTMRVPDEDTPATMDYSLHQFMIAPAGGEDVTGVVLVRGDERMELPAGAIAEDAAE